MMQWFDVNNTTVIKIYNTFARHSFIGMCFLYYDDRNLKVNSFLKYNVKSRDWKRFPKHILLSIYPCQYPKTILTTNYVSEYKSLTHRLHEYGFHVRLTGRKARYIEQTSKWNLMYKHRFMLVRICNIWQGMRKMGMLGGEKFFNVC